LKIGIGIDTGGTYTDAVVYNFESGRVISAAKSLTTKNDLRVGILGALDLLDRELCRSAEIIALSTTLATNACVENKGGRAKLIFIGMDKSTMERQGSSYGVFGSDNIYYCGGSGSFDGKVLPQVDWESFDEGTKDWLKDAEGIGIVEVNAVNNGAPSEQEAKRRLKEKFDVPIICGSDLFTEVNSIRRGAGTMLNARLVPVVKEFIAAIKAAMAERDIKAPIVIVRSDGSLMSEEFSQAKPVETILCGPAASVLGGLKLSNRSSSVIVDMGGTTTDISLVKNSRPVKAKDGVSVGSWRTFVKGVFIDTFGLGGDSAVRPGDAGFSLGEQRILPVSLLALEHPEIKEELKKLLRTTKYNAKPIYEYYTLLHDIDDKDGFNEDEKRLCRALKERPLMMREAMEAAGTDIYHTARFNRIESEGIILRSGLTPTDFMHIKGDFDVYDTEAAVLAARFLMRSLGLDDSAEGEIVKFADSVYEAVRKKLYKNIVRILLQDKHPLLRRNGIDRQLNELIDRAWEEFRSGKDSFFEIPFRTKATLVGIGAPTHIFLADVAKALGTECVIPENAHVANAVGAVVGNITADVTVEIKPNFTPAGTDGYFVCAAQERKYFRDREDASAEARRLAKELAIKEAALRGISGDITVELAEEDKIGHAMLGQIDLGSTIVATAIGGAIL